MGGQMHDQSPFFNMVLVNHSAIQMLRKRSFYHKCHVIWNNFLGELRVVNGLIDLK